MKTRAMKNRAITSNGFAVVGDTLIDKSCDNEEVKIIGFFMAPNGLEMAAFDKGNPICAHGGPMYWDYEIKKSSN